jgi:hypothetical protein
MMGSAETRPLLDEFSPLVERKLTNGVWGTRAKYALATLALVGVAAFAGVAVFPGAADNIATLGDKSDFVAEAPSHHRSSTKSHSRLYVPRGSSRLGEEAEHPAPAPAAESSHAESSHGESVEGSAFDAEIAQLKADKSALEQTNADLMTQIETLVADTSAQDALKKCQADMHDVQKEAKQAADDLDAVEEEMISEREAHKKVGSFNCGRVLPGEDRDEKLAQCDKEMRKQLFERKKANTRKYQMRLQNDALHSEIEGLESKLLELDGEVRMCISDSAAAAKTAADELAAANKQTEETQVAMGKVEYELDICMNGKKICDTKVHDMEGELKDMEAREDKCEADFAEASKMFQDTHASKDAATQQLNADIERLTLDNKNVKDKRDSLEKDLNEKFAEVKTLEETVKQNQAAAEEATNGKAACADENNMISASIDHLKNDAKRMEQTLNMTRESKLAMVDEVMRLNTKMEELEGEILEADNHLKSVVNASVAEKQELVGKAMEKDEQIASIKTEVASLKAAVNVSAAAELSLQGRLAAAQDKAAAAQLDLEGQVTECQTAAAAARDAFNEKHADNSEASQELKGQIKELEAQMAAAAEGCKKGKAECEAEIASLHDDINAKSQEVQAALAQVDAKTADMDVCYAATDKLHTENAALIGSIDQYTSELEAKTEERALCEAGKNALLEDNKKCEASVEQCEADGAAEREVLLKKHLDANGVNQQLITDLDRTQNEVKKCVVAKTTAVDIASACTTDVDAAQEKTKLVQADMTELKMQPWCQPPNPPAPDAPAPPPPANPPGSKKFDEKMPVAEKKLIAENVASAKAVKIIDAIMLGSDITSDKVRPFVNLDKPYNDATVSYVFAHCYADEMNMIAAEVTVEGGKAYLTAQGEGVRSTQNCRDQDLDAAEVTAAWKNQLGEDDAWTEYGYMPGASLGGVRLVDAKHRLAREIKAAMPVDAPAAVEEEHHGRALLGGNPPPARVHCSYSWNAWSTCAPLNGACGVGSQYSTVRVHRHPRNGGNGCPGTRRQTCNAGACSPPPSPSPPPPSPSPPPPSPPPPSPPPPRAKLGLGTVEYVIVNNVGGLEVGAQGKPMYTPSDAFLSVPEVATMIVGDAVKMAKAYKNPSATEDEASYLFAACDGDDLNIVSAKVTAEHGSAFITLGEAKSKKIPRSNTSPGCSDASLTAGSVAGAFASGDAAGAVTVANVYFTQAEDGDEVTDMSPVEMGDISSVRSVEVKSACFIGSSIGVSEEGCSIAKAFKTSEATDGSVEYIFATCKDEHMTMVSAKVALSDAPEEPEDLAVMDEEEDQEPLEDEETEDSAPTKRKSRKARRKARRSKRKARRSKRKKNLKKLFGRRLTFANLVPDISEMMDKITDGAALPVWVTDKANVATITVTGAATGKCIDGAMTPATVKAAFNADSAVNYGPALSIGRFAWTDHDTTQTDVIDAVKTVIEKPEPEPEPEPVPEPAAPAPVECSGRKVTAKRMDPNGLDGHGWGMNLEFMCGDSKVSIGGSRGSQSASAVVNTPMFEGDCAPRVDKSNWLGGYGYGDFFHITVGECPSAF